MNQNTPDLEGLDLTDVHSYASVVIIQKPKGFLVSFPRDAKLFRNIINIPGALSSNDSPVPGTIFVPRAYFKQLQTALGKKVLWRTKEDLERDKTLLKRKQESLSDVLDRIEKDIDTSYMKIEPYSFQKLAVSWATEGKGKDKKIVGGLLADQMGLGKTLEGLTTACKLKYTKGIKRCLVICPATLKTQWQQEVEKFTNESSIVIKTTGSKDPFLSRKKLFDRVVEEDFFFTIINYELLYQRETKKVVNTRGKTASGKRKTKKVYGDFLDLEEIKKIGYDMVIIDEAHKMKNPDTLTAQSIRQIDADFKLLMTGTPIQKELKNLFQLFDYIHPNILLKENIDDFDTRRRYFEEQFLLRRLNPFIYPAREIDYYGEKNIKVLRSIINPFMLRRLTEDVSDEIPDQSEITVTVEFSDYQKRLYDKATKEMKDLDKELKTIPIYEEDKREKIENNFKAIAQIRNIICDAPNVLTQSESIVTKKIIGKRKSFPQIPKADRLLEMLSEICIENSEKVVIFTRYARVARYLKVIIDNEMSKQAKKKNITTPKSFIYEGETKQGCQLRDDFEKKGLDTSKAICSGCPFYDLCETRTKYAWHFQNDENTKILICTDAANFGVNLQKGRHLINYDLPDNFSVYLQRSGRIRRLGSEHQNVFVYNLVTSGGVDERKLKELRRQMKINEKLIENKEDDMAAINAANDFIENILNEI